MSILDPAAEYLRLSEHYRAMSDEELLLLAAQTAKLTPFAQQALASEIRQRGLKIEPTEDQEPAAVWPAKPALQFERTAPKFRASSSDAADDSADADSADEDPYDEDRELVTLCTVWSLRDALKIQRLLDVAGIPFYMGPEKATGVDQVTSDFAKGLDVQIMRVGVTWAGPLLRDYFPQDEPVDENPPDDAEELPIRCPRCHSTGVVFDRLSSEPGAPATKKFEWTCDACGEQWHDDGVAKEQ